MKLRIHRTSISIRAKTHKRIKVSAAKKGQPISQRSEELIAAGFDKEAVA